MQEPTDTFAINIAFDRKWLMDQNSSTTSVVVTKQTATPITAMTQFPCPVCAKMGKSLHLDMLTLAKHISVHASHMEPTIKETNYPVDRRSDQAAILESGQDALGLSEDEMLAMAIRDSITDAPKVRNTDIIIQHVNKRLAKVEEYEMDDDINID